MNKWAEYTFHWDDAPLDISPLFAEEVPAGKFGFLKCDGDKFKFENGRIARFWGVLLNSSACFPTHEQADKVARRLAKFGVNLVRLHQFDAEWATPNIFQLSKGSLKDNTRSFDPECRDRLDYLIHALEKEGIYIYMDLLIYRTFKVGDGLENSDQLSPNGAKPYSCFDEDIIALEKEYASQLLTHVNPYTGKRLVDDPGMAMVLVTNENDMFMPYPITAEPYRSRFLQKFRDWAAVNAPDFPIPDDFVFDFRKTKPPVEILRFYQKVQIDYLHEMNDFLHSIGVKCPIADDSLASGLTLPSTLRDADFICDNVYWDLWDDYGTNKDLIADRKQVFGMVPSKIRLAGKPFIISEWDAVWPNEFRASAALLVASMANFQSWSGTLLHTYRYRTTPADCMGGTMLGGIPYRKNFETFMDPAKFGLFYAASLMLRRGDVAPALETTVIALREENIFDPETAITFHNAPNVAATHNCEKHRVEIRFEDENIPENAIAPAEMGEAADDIDCVLSDTGEIFRSWKEKYGWIDTAKTKSIYGTFKPGQTVRINGLEVTFAGGFTTLTFTSLDGADLDKSQLILITAVGRSDNTGALYNTSHTERISMGHGPVIYEITEAEIKLDCDGTIRKLWSVDTDGAYTGNLPVVTADGKHTFTIGEKMPSIYYLLSV